MAETSKPTVILLLGDDELAIQDRLADLIARLGDPGIMESNLARFTGPRLDMGAFEAALLSVPFLAPRRMVVLDMGPPSNRPTALPDRLFEILEAIPPTSVLVVVERVDYAPTRRPSGKTKGGRHPGRGSAIYRWAAAHPELAVTREHPSPRGPAFERWLAGRAKELGGEIAPDGAALLREYSGEDTRLADQELRKLIDFVDAARPISREDVARLTPFHAETNIFAVVDALGTRDGRRAVRLLWQILEEEDPRYVFGMIARQIRLLTLARQALDDGQSPADVLSASPHRLPGFASEKIGRQALGFSMAQLRAIYRELFSLDLATKTGKADLQVGLESLVASLAR